MVLKSLIGSEIKGVDGGIVMLWLRLASGGVG